jgi:hypothetical protein
MNKYMDYLEQLKEQRIFPRRETGPICTKCFFYTKEIKPDKEKIYDRIKKRIGAFIKCRNPKKIDKVQFNYCTFFTAK